MFCLASAGTGLAVGVALSQIVPSLFKERANPQEEEPSEPSSTAERLIKAIYFSSEKHKDQRRKNAKRHPYICHPVRVAHRLAFEGGVTDENVLIAAFLHDTIEDTDATLDEVRALFGPDVAKIVGEVSDDKSLPKERRKQLQIEHAPHISREAKLVKLSDKLDNLTDLLSSTPEDWTPERVAEYFEWAKSVVAGLRGTNEELERKLNNVFAQSKRAVNAAKDLGVE